MRNFILGVAASLALALIIGAWLVWGWKAGTILALVFGGGAIVVWLLCALASSIPRC